jgi:hypothetical protein
MFFRLQSLVSLVPLGVAFRRFLFTVGAAASSVICFGRLLTLFSHVCVPCGVSPGEVKGEVLDRYHTFFFELGNGLIRSGKNFCIQLNSIFRFLVIEVFFVTICVKDMVQRSSPLNVHSNYLALANSDRISEISGYFQCIEGFLEFGGLPRGALFSASLGNWLLISDKGSKGYMTLFIVRVTIIGNSFLFSSSAARGACFSSSSLPCACCRTTCGCCRTTWLLGISPSITLEVSQTW